MTTITLQQVGPQTACTRYHIFADGCRVGFAIELADDKAAPWRLTLPGYCTNLRRSSREILLKTIERLLPPWPARNVVYVPTRRGSEWDAIADTLRAAGYDVQPAPMTAIRGE